MNLPVVGPSIIYPWLSFGFLPHGVSRVMGNKLVSGVLEAITIGLRNRERIILRLACFNNNF